MRGLMNVFLLPFFLSVVLPHQIQLTDDSILTPKIFRAGDIVTSDYLAINPTNWILLKSIVESSDNNCKSALNDTIAICKHQLETCHDTCNAIPDDEKLFIRALETEIETTKRDLDYYKKRSEIFKYVVIGVGAIALTSSSILFIDSL